MARLTFKRHAPLMGLYLAAGLAGAPAIAATSGYVETWDTDEAGWFANTTGALVSNPGVNGDKGPDPLNPDLGGFLRSTVTNPPNGFDIGATTELAALTGSFAAGVWTVDVALNQIVPTVDKIWLRFRYQNSSFNGWRFVLSDGSPGDGWVGRTVSFDSTWSDADAVNNGWEQDLGGPVVSFAQTLSNVYRTEIRVAGGPDTVVGIDNFKLTMANPIPEPSTYALMALGLGAVGLTARRRRRG